MMERKSRFQIYVDNKGKYRWNLRADNNRIIVDSAEGYHNKDDCLHGIHLVRELAPVVKIEDMTKNYII